MKKELCIALGDFDGVHLGHQAIINSTVNNELNLTPAVYTFNTNCKGAKLITDNEQKEALLRKYGIKEVIFGEFNKIKDLSPTEFVNDILISDLNAKVIVCGTDFKFGKNAVGDVSTLEAICKEHKIKLCLVDILDFTQDKISSSDIRERIENGDMENVSKLLGRYYSIVGIVEHGKKLGTVNQTPTVNLSINPDRIIPSYGVYITRTKINGKFYNSISNVGVRPSVEQTDIPNIETNIFDFADDLYGEKITVEFIKKIRDEKKFCNKDDLFTQVKQDIGYARSYHNGETND